MKTKPETLSAAISRVESLIDLKRKSAGKDALLVMVSIRDVERLIHAAIWGDDA